MQRLALFGGIALLTACGGKAVDDDDDDFFSDNTGNGIGDIGEDTGYVANADAPVIISADVYCDYTEC